MKVTEAGNTLVLTDASEAEKKRILSAIKEKPEQRKTLTRKQVAEILHVHPGSIKRYDRAGILTPIRITPRTVRYDTDEVECLLNQRKG
jgi:hypothetical protein